MSVVSFGVYTTEPFFKKFTPKQYMYFETTCTGGHEKIMLKSLNTLFLQTYKKLVNFLHNDQKNVFDNISFQNWPYHLSTVKSY